MDHAYTLSGSQADQPRLVVSNVHGKIEEGDEDEDNNVEDSQDNEYYDGNHEDNSMDDGQEEVGETGFTSLSYLGDDDLPTQTFTVLLPTEEWMQMLPPQYLLHYIRERTVFRDSGRAVREGRETTAPLKRGWLQGSWRETLKNAIAKQTDIPCVINFNTSNFLKQPFSRKVGPPIWRVGACCRQDDGLCLKFHLKVQDFHPSKPHVELIVSARGTLLEGPEGATRHTFTASDHMKAIKSMQRYNATSSPQSGPNGFSGLTTTVDNSEETLMDPDDGEVQRLKMTLSTRQWISFLPADAAEAYVLERSHVTKERLGLVSAEAWCKGLRHFAPRVTKECRQYLKRALAQRTGLPCRIGLTGRCHLKPPFSRKKRAPLFVTNGFCGRKDFKCLRFKFTVQDFDPQSPFVTVNVEIRGQLLTGPEGEERHTRRPTDDLLVKAGAPRPGKRAIAGAGGQDDLPHGKRRRIAQKGGKKPASPGASATDAYAEAVQSLQNETWPGDFDLQSAEVVLDDAKGKDSDSPKVDFVAGEAAMNTIQVLSDATGEETALGEDAARELVQLANEALTLAAGGGAGGAHKSQLTATKIVQSGDQVFIFVSDPNDVQSGEAPVIEAVEMNSDDLVAETGENADEAAQVAEASDALVEYLLPGSASDQVLDADVPCMEYRWELHLPMADWLRLLPARSLRYYIHERTVGREVWVEQGWERQFRSQTLQQGWRDAIRRAAVEQTDIPCQVCFRGRSSLKLPFSRKHAAALWRTQGYCARGDHTCLTYKFCVQDFHPDDEAVSIQVYAAGKMHRDCRKWFQGQGTLVEPESVPREWPECDVELEGDEAAEAEAEAMEEFSERVDLTRVKQEPGLGPGPEPESDDWDPGSDSASEEEPEDKEGKYEEEQERDEEAEEEEEEDEEEEEEVDVPTSQQAKVASKPAGNEFCKAVLKSIDALRANVFKARRCPLKMQVALRLVRNADQLVAAPCKTVDCLCRPQPPPRPSCRPRWRWPEKARGGVVEAEAAVPVSVPAATIDMDVDMDADGDAEGDAEPESAPELEPATASHTEVVQRSPLRIVATQSLTTTSCLAAPGPSAVAVTTPQPVTSTSPKETSVSTLPNASSESTPPSSGAQRVARSASLLVTAAVPRRHVKVLTSSAAASKSQPSIIKLSPAQIAANARPGTVVIASAPTPSSSSASTPTSNQARPYSKLISLSSAIVRSAVPTPSLIKPVISPIGKQSGRRIMGTPIATSTPAPARGRPPVSQSVVSSSQDRVARNEEGGAVPTWIMDEMRSVILGGEDKKAQSALQNKVATPVAEVDPDADPDPDPVAKAVSSSEGAKPLDRKVTAETKVEASEAGEPSEVASLARSEARLNPEVEVEGKAEVEAEPQAKVHVEAEAEEQAEAQPKPAPNATPKSSPKLTPKPAIRSSPRPGLRCPTRPVTRGTSKVVVQATAAPDPPPLVSDSRASTPAEAPSPAKGSRLVVVDTKSSGASPQPAKVPTRTVQTRLLTSVLADKAPFPKGGKVLILKPSSPMLRSSLRKTQ